MDTPALRPPARRRAFDKLREQPRHWLLLALLTMLGLAAVVTGVVGASLTDDKWSDDLSLEIAKGGVQVIAVGVLGGALAAIWRNINADREKERQRNDKVCDELVSLVALYGKVKAVRRTLRSLGLDPKTYPHEQQDALTSGGVLTQERAQGFHEQMTILNRLQLDFEAKARQFGETDFLGEDTDQVVRHLGTIDEHLNRVLALWEEEGWTIRAGTPLQMVCDGLEPLFRVRAHFRPNVAAPMKEITRLINKQVFGEATYKTQDALAAIDRAHKNREEGDQNI